MKRLLCIILPHRAQRLANGYAWFPLGFSLPGIKAQVSQCSRCGALYASQFTEEPPSLQVGEDVTL